MSEKPENHVYVLLHCGGISSESGRVTRVFRNREKAKTFIKETDKEFMEYLESALSSETKEELKRLNLSVPDFAKRYGHYEIIESEIV